MIYFIIKGFKPDLMFDFHQAFTTETVCIAVCDIILFRIIKGDTVALAGGYIAHLTFEGGITTGTGFYFVARHMAMMQKYYLQAIPDPYLKLYRDARILRASRYCI